MSVVIILRISTTGKTCYTIAGFSDYFKIFHVFSINSKFLQLAEKPSGVFPFSSSMLKSTSLFLLHTIKRMFPYHSVWYCPKYLSFSFKPSLSISNNLLADSIIIWSNIVNWLYFIWIMNNATNNLKITIRVHLF